MKKKKSKQKKYSLNERRAYWVGVGVCAERHGDSEKYLKSADSKIAQSFYNGYEADNHKSLAEKLMIPRKKK